MTTSDYPTSADSTRRVAVLGAGAWGTAVAAAMAARHEVMLWSRRAEVVADVQLTRMNQRYLPGVTLASTLKITDDFADAVRHGVDGLILAAPLAGLRALCQQLRHLVGTQVPDIIWLCKGIDAETLERPSEVVTRELGVAGAALSGPSFADEVALGLPAAIVLASRDAALIERVHPWVHGGSLRVYASDDVVGVEIGGAVKNIIAIAAGISDGLALGANARAALITRGLAEMTRLGCALGAQQPTFAGLAGMGDLVLTCTGDRSRNRRVGLALAQGLSLPEILQNLGHVSEGVACAGAMRTLAQRCDLDLPITEAVAEVLFDGVTPADALRRLMARRARWEQ